MTLQFQLTYHHHWKTFDLEIQDMSTDPPEFIDYICDRDLEKLKREIDKHVAKRIS